MKVRNTLTFRLISFFIIITLLIGCNSISKKTNTQKATDIQNTTNNGKEKVTDNAITSNQKIQDTANKLDESYFSENENYTYVFSRGNKIDGSTFPFIEYEGDHPDVELIKLSINKKAGDTWIYKDIKYKLLNIINSHINIDIIDKDYNIAETINRDVKVAIIGQYNAEDKQIRVEKWAQNVGEIYYENDDGFYGELIEIHNYIQEN